MVTVTFTKNIQRHLACPSFEAEGTTGSDVSPRALDIDSTGERLAFGSTTGALCISEDGGDHWTEVTAHLPPIYSVRFE